ncbi:exosortase A [Alteromonas aestuariivivens]|uniref:Exosortase A n=1 Tax=Alteromonas aestuariivivens TaxID=1938339 RepID=A0A3D8MED2_9ALTE|nr:exosortase A [Alteromonas aestuariivivens]RDV29187.1 exosortase A [Alteromonas aestuariivivens]
MKWFREERNDWQWAIGLTAILWLAFCWQGLWTAAQIWWGNEIFNHGFFIVPGALYLIYLKRYALQACGLKSTLLPLLAIGPTLLLYVIGIAGDVQLFMHIATFTLLPLLLWALLGHRAAYVVVFPLCFILFSVPVGEQLIPYLQEITADGSVALLKATGIPLYRNGLYIEIPQGRFLVAEACSGVSFFIASIVIGTLYAYLNLRKASKRILFTLISIAFPVIANIIRVYGIILIAYQTDMKHAAGADHLIYGWFFFALVIMCLLGIGELMRDKDAQWEAPKQSGAQLTAKVSNVHVSVLALLLLSGTAWTGWVQSNLASFAGAESHSFTVLKNAQSGCQSRHAWQPAMSNPTAELMQFMEADGRCEIQFYQAWFNGDGNELVSDLNRLYAQHDWSLEASATVTVQLENHQLTLPVRNLVSPLGKRVQLVHWYEVDGQLFSGQIQTKLYQIRNALLGGNTHGSVKVLVAPVTIPLDSLTSRVSGLNLNSAESR